MDFGTGKYLENDMVTDDHGCHGPWGYGPEACLGKDYSYNADVPYMGREFAQLASYCGDDTYDPFHVLYGKEKDIWSGGIEGAWKCYNDLVQTEYKLTFKGADRYGPEFEKLITSIHAYHPEERPTPAEVVLALKKL